MSDSKDWISKPRLYALPGSHHCRYCDAKGGSLSYQLSFGSFNLAETSLMVFLSLETDTEVFLRKNKTLEVFTCKIGQPCCLPLEGLLELTQ